MEVQLAYKFKSLSRITIEKLPIILLGALLVTLNNCGSLDLPTNTEVANQEAKMPVLFTTEDDRAYVRVAEHKLKNRRDLLVQLQGGLIVGTIGSGVPGFASGLLHFSSHFAIRTGLAAATFVGIDTVYAPKAQIAIIDQEIAVLRCIDSGITEAKNDPSLQLRKIENDTVAVREAYNNAVSALNTYKKSDSPDEDTITAATKSIATNKEAIDAWANPISILNDSIQNATDAVIDQTNAQLDAGLPNAQAYLTMINGLNVGTGGSGSKPTVENQDVDPGNKKKLPLDAGKNRADGEDAGKALTDSLTKLNSAVLTLAGTTPPTATAKIFDLQSCVAGGNSKPAS